MREYWRLNLSLNPGNPLQKEAWEILSSIPRGHRTDAVCRAVIAHTRQEAMLDQIREVIREELKYLPIEPETQQETQDDDDAVLGFLRALQGGEFL